MKDLTGTFNTLLQDKRVRSEQSKYEAVQKQRSSVINRYKRAYQEFLDLVAGLHGAKNWYAEMKETVGSLEKNVESFVNNRRSEGSQLLNQIEESQSSNKTAQAELERERLQGLMERMSMSQQPRSPPQQNSARPTPRPLFQSGQAPRYGQNNYPAQYHVPTSPPPNQANMPRQAYQGYGNQPPGQTYGAPPANTYGQPAGANTYGQPTYNPGQFGRTPGPTSPPPNQASFGMSAMRGPTSPPPNQVSFGQTHPQAHQSYGGGAGGNYGGYGGSQTPQQAPGGYAPPGFVPPPPPPGPPPLGPQQTIHYAQQQQQQQQSYPGYGSASAHPQSAHPHSAHPQSAQAQQPHDPWAGLNAWK